MKKLFTPLLLLSLATGACAQTWTGASNNNWFNAANWNPATVPGAASSVVIPGSLGTYPTLTADVTIAGLTMNSGSALHLGTKNFTNNGSVSITGATVNGGGTFTVAGAGSVSITTSAFTTVTTISNYTGAASIYDNSFTGNTTISDAPTQNNNSNNIDGNTITGNLVLTHASVSAEMDEGYGAPSGTGNHILGNATFNLTGAGAFISSYSHGLHVDGNLVVSRTASGNTNLFNAGTSAIGQGFTFTQNVGGGSVLINQANTSTVTMNSAINITSVSPASFHMYRMKSNGPGGAISVTGAGDLDFRKDTVNAITNLTGYTGPATIFDNSITGATTISDAAIQNNNTNYIDGNLITGALTLTHASVSAEMDEGYGSPSGTANHFSGSATINITGGGNFFSSYSHMLRVDGNLSISRTAAGSTNLYYVAGSGNAVGGNFSFTQSGGSGNTYINQANTSTVTINGTVNITSSAAGIFNMYRIKNYASGGTIAVSGPTSLDVRNDTLQAITGFTGYTGPATIFDNSIVGATTISDAATQNNNTNYFDGNLITGAFSLTHASVSAEMDEGYSSPSGNGNHISGAATFTISGGGNFYSSYSHALRVDGGLTVNRTAAGLTDLYRVVAAGNSVGGNFSYSTVGGSSYINEIANATVTINGTVNISSPTTGTFHMYRLKNYSNGGTITVSGAGDLDIRNDTVYAVTNFTGYTGPATIFDNSITGATTISDAATQNNNTNYFDGNLITGAFSLTHASATAEMDEGYSSPSGNGNHIAGNATYTLSGSTFASAYTHPLHVDGNLSINRTASATTYLFNSGPSAVAGSFTFNQSTATGDVYVNQYGISTTTIVGSMSITSAAASLFRMYRMKNFGAGGAISVSNSNSLDVRNDTLNAVTIGFTGYTGPAYVFDNSFTGAASISDAPIQNNSNNYVDGNLFNGNLTLVHSSATGNMYEGYNSPAGGGNIIKGTDSIVNLTGATMYLGYSHPHRADGSVVINGSSANSIIIGSIALGGGTAGHLRQAGAERLSVPYLNLSKTSGAIITLDTALALTNALTFTSGYLSSTALHPLVFASGATHTGAGNSSHATGFVLKAGNQAFTFPLGNGAYYSPAGITAPAVATDTFSAQYFPVPPAAAGYDPNLHDASINHVSGKEYWLINRVGATSSNVQVILGYNLPNSGPVTNMSQLTVAHWYNNGTSLAWHDEGNGGTTGTNAMGTVESSNIVSSFSPFTVASTTIANPLPIVLGDFSARRVQASAQLDWVVQSENNIAGFDIQRSPDGSSWKDIGDVASTGNSATAHTYQYTDASPVAGKNFYRLRIKDYSGLESYTAVRTVMMDELRGDEIVVYPNPVATFLNIKGRINTATLSDATGRIMYSGGGDIDMRRMPSGLYLLRVQKADGTRASFKIMKQ